MNVQIPCTCPPKADGSPRHDEDSVTLKEKLSFREATAIRNAIGFAKLDDPDMDSAEIMAILTESYILHGVEGWSLVDDKGKAVPVTKGAIRTSLLADASLAEAVGDAADGLYGPVILLPLVARALSSSEPTQTDGSTSPTTSGPQKPRKRSKPSSITSIQTAGTETTTGWHGGVSNSSPSSATAA